MSRRQQVPVASPQFIRKYTQWVVNPNGSNFRKNYCNNESWCPNFKKKHPTYGHLCFFYHPDSPSQANESEDEYQQQQNDGVPQEFLVKFAYWKNNPERSNFRKELCHYGDKCVKFQIKHPKFDHLCAFKHSDPDENEQPQEQTIQQVYIMTSDLKKKEASTNKTVNNQASSLGQKEVKPQINGQKNNSPSKPMWQIMAANRKKQPAVKSETLQAKNPSIKNATFTEQQSKMQQKQIKLQTQPKNNQHQKNFKQQLPATTKPQRTQSFCKPRLDQIPVNEQRMPQKNLQQQPAFDTKQIIAKMCSLIPFFTQIKGEQVDEQISNEFYKISQSMSKIETIYNKLVDQQNALIE